MRRVFFVLSEVGGVFEVGVNVGVVEKRAQVLECLLEVERFKQKLLQRYDEISE